MGAALRKVSTITIDIRSTATADNFERALDHLR